MKLNKEQLEEHERLLGLLRGSNKALADAVEAYNAQAKANYSKVEDAVTAYNLHNEEARNFLNQIIDEIDAEIDELEGSEGEDNISDVVEALRSQRQEWNSIDMDDLEIDCPHSLDEGYDEIDEFEALPKDA
jgi:polyhydroxyalkanoate synthesis regulator phasin